MKKTDKKSLEKRTASVKKTSKQPFKQAIKTSTQAPMPNNKDKKQDEKTAILLGARKRKGTPAIFKLKEKKQKHTPIVFSLDDVQDFLKASKTKKETPANLGTQAASTHSLSKNHKATAVPDAPEIKKRVLGAASLSDILGFNPVDKNSKPITYLDESQVEKKDLKYYKALIELREHVKTGLDMHAKETLKRSLKEDSGDLSSYNISDSGSDNFDRDIALNLVSSEQDLLFEIEEAIVRIKEGTYGVCEITQEPINGERLMAVPFTRYSLEGQKQLESTKRKGDRNSGSFAESTLEDSAQYTDDDAGE